MKIDIVVLGAGYHQDKLHQLALNSDERGRLYIVTPYDTDLSRKTKQADPDTHIIYANVLDTHKILNHIDLIRRPVAISTASEAGAMGAALLNSALGYTHHYPPVLIAQTHNKRLLAQRLAKLGIESHHLPHTQPTEAVIIKPSTGTSSHGVYLIPAGTNPEYYRARYYAAAGHGVDHTPVVQRYLKGTVWHIDGSFTIDLKSIYVTVYATAEQTRIPHSYAADSHQYPSTTITTAALTRGLDILNQILADHRSQIPAGRQFIRTWTNYHAEFISPEDNPDDPTLIDLGLRLPGCTLGSTVLQAHTGNDPTELELNHIITATPFHQAPANRNDPRPACLLKMLSYPTPPNPPDPTELPHYLSHNHDIVKEAWHKASILPSDRHAYIALKHRGKLSSNTYAEHTEELRAVARKYEILRQEAIARHTATPAA